MTGHSRSNGTPSRCRAADFFGKSSNIACLDVEWLAAWDKLPGDLCIALEGHGLKAPGLFAAAFDFDGLCKSLGDFLEQIEGQGEGAADIDASLDALKQLHAAAQRPAAGHCKRCPPQATASFPRISPCLLPRPR